MGEENVGISTEQRQCERLQHTTGILDWTVNELQDMDRKLMMINQALHPKANVDRLYVNRNVGGRRGGGGVN